MSSSDDEGGGFGDLFAGADEPEPEYPIETLVADRLVMAREGTTNAGFTPLYSRFDNPPTSSTKEKGTHRLDALAPPPLQVKYRNKRHSLWGHRLWNAAKYLTKRMDEGSIDVFGKSVLELGAGLGVPTLSAYRNGARLAVVTDYPDADLMDIIRLNVEQNCTPDQIDADVKQRLAALADASGAASCTQCIAEPLLWGNASHMRTVMQYTPGQSGFDVLILSDILFNHVCNEDLADTVFRLMANTPTAAAYCVFSHHRAFKQLNDFEFFDKCVARGLCYEQIDEEAYPMMFPEDRGPEEVRMPVKCYKITHRLDAAGPAVNSLPTQQVFDVVIQGTGMVQAYLSAALSRSGVKVLHCDGADQYGGPFRTLTVPQLIAALEHCDGKASSSSHAAAAEVLPPLTGRIVEDRVASLLDEKDCRRFAVDLFPTTYVANGDALQKLVAANMVRTVDFQRVARFLVLCLPADDREAHSPAVVAKELPLTRGSVFATDLISLLDKRRLMKFVKDIEASLAEPLHAKTANPADNPQYSGVGSNVPRARENEEAFLHEVIGKAPAGSTLRDLLRDKYEVSPAALDMMTLLGELDRDASDVITPPRPRVREEGTDDTAELFPQIALAKSVQQFRELLTSVGMYQSATPFLLPCYGASELAQSLCRTSAVWGGTFVLRRSVHHITLNEETEQQHAVLSNGQAIRAKVVVVPTETAGALPIRLADWQHAWLRAVAMQCHGHTHPAELPWEVPSVTIAHSGHVEGDRRDQQTVMADAAEPVAYARVVVVAKTPLFSWSQLTAHGVTAPRPDVDIEGAPPVVVALVRAQAETSAPAAVVHIVQHSAGCEQAPEDGASVVVHFTADAHALGEADLLAFIQRTFLGSDTQAASGEEASQQPFGWSTPSTQVALMVSFTLDAHRVAEASQVADTDVVDPPSETWKSHDFALQECAKLTDATRKDRENLLHAVSSSAATSGSASGAVGDGEEKLTAASLEAALLARQPEAPMALPEWASVLSVPTLRRHPLDDGQYQEAAVAAYARVWEKLGRAEEAAPFLQRVPDNVV